MRNILSINNSAFPEVLRTIPGPPEQLYVTGEGLEEIMRRPRVAIVGSRKVTAYGKAVTEKIAGELASRGVVIISGLALGIDAIAHRATLEAGGLTLAVLPSGISPIYPGSNRELARQIVRQGGALLSEYPDGTPAYKTNFVARNRLVSGLGDILVVTEAAEKSGTMHTADFANKQGRPVFAVPGNITSPQSAGTNLLIQNGAHILLSSQDVLAHLNLASPAAQQSLPMSTDPTEQLIINLLAEGENDGSALLLASQLPVQAFNQALTMLEIKGIVKNQGNNQWSLV